MTGSEQGGVLFGMGGLATACLGVVLLIVGMLAAHVWPVQWWFFLPGGTFVVLGILGIALLFFGRYTVSQTLYYVAILITLEMARLSYMIGEPVAVVLALCMTASVGFLAYSNFKRHG